MPLRPVASLAVKLLGLYAVIGALPSLGLIVSFFVDGTGAGGGLVSPWKIALINALPGSLQMIVGIGLWAFSDGISHSLVKDEGELPVSSHTAVGAILFSAVGAFSLVEFAVQLARFLSSLWTVNQSMLRPEDAHIGARDMVPMLVRGALGLWLLLGARSLVRGVLNFKNWGRDSNAL